MKKEEKLNNQIYYNIFKIKIKLIIKNKRKLIDI